MNKTNNPNLTEYSKKLRREMTKEERHLWYDFLKPLPFTFHRQKVIGSYIVDFYCAKAKLVIELDGSQHYEDAGRGYPVKACLNGGDEYIFDASGNSITSLTNLVTYENWKKE